MSAVKRVDCKKKKKTQEKQTTSAKLSLLLISSFYTEFPLSRVVQVPSEVSMYYDIQKRDHYSIY